MTTGQKSSTWGPNRLICEVIRARYHWTLSPGGTKRAKRPSWRRSVGNDSKLQSVVEPMLDIARWDLLWHRNEQSSLATIPWHPHLHRWFPWWTWPPATPRWTSGSSEYLSKCWGRRVVAIPRFTSLTFPFQSQFRIFLGDSPCVCAMFDDNAWPHDINHLRILGCSWTQITTMGLAPVKKNLQIPVALADGDLGCSCDEVGKGWAQPCCDLRNFGMECVHSQWSKW